MRSMCGADAGCLAINYNSLCEGLPPAVRSAKLRSFVPDRFVWGGNIWDDFISEWWGLRRAGLRHTGAMIDSGTSLGGVSREQKMLKGHLPRVIYHQLYFNIRRLQAEFQPFTGQTSSKPPALSHPPSGGEIPFKVEERLIWEQVFFFQKLHENYYTNASGRDLCVVIFLSRFLKEKYLFPD